MSKGFQYLFLLISMGGFPITVFAAEETLDKADNAFMMIATALVIFMILPGIALFMVGY